MEEEIANGRPSALVLSSFTSAAGLALGELLLLTGRPEELLEHLRALHIAARATLMASDLEAYRGPIKRPGVSLSIAAFGVVRAWHAESKNPQALGDAIALLEEVLEEMGVRYVAPETDDG
jgi:hypothetical protein